MEPHSLLQTFRFSTCLNSTTSRKARKFLTAICDSSATLQCPLLLTPVSGTRWWSRCPQSSAVPRRWSRTKQKWPWTLARQSRSMTCASLPYPCPLFNRHRCPTPPSQFNRRLTPVVVCVQAPQLPFWLLFLIVSYGGKFSTKACLSLSLPRHSREGQIPNSSSIKSSSKTSDLNLRAARTC